MIYIIADDLTSASDTGVQLVKQGLRTVVVINPAAAVSMIDLQQPDVLVMDTETRDLGQEEAVRKLDRALSPLLKAASPTGNQDLFYKKIDSTLRGNIGLEIEMLMERLGSDITLLTPAFPASGYNY